MKRGNQLSALTLAQAAKGLAEKKFTSLELVDSLISRRKQVEPKLQAFLSSDDEAARSTARAIDEQRAAGAKLHPLAGVAVSVKDNFNQVGTQTTAASKILEGYISPYDATAVKKLRDAGVILFGKTNLDEFAMGSSTENSAFQVTKNPWDTTRVPGGSSGGSAAAVAADATLAALGTDTGGSIRQPAALTNTTGLKPTYGRISRYGVIALASSLDVVGTLTKTAEDAALLLEVLAGSDPHDATCRSEFAPVYSEHLDAANLKGLKIGIPKEYYGQGLDPQIMAAIEEAKKVLIQLGAEIRDVSLPHTKYALPTYYILLPSEASANLARYDGIRYGESVMRTADATTRDLLEVYMRSRAIGFGPEPTRRIMLGTYSLSAGYYDAYYRKALKVRTLVRRDFEEAFKEVNVLLTPTTPTTAFKIGEKAQDPLAMYMSDIMTVAINVAGVPALSLPCGLSNGLPVGMQLITEDLNEETLLKIGHVYQRSTDWHSRKPALQ
jgi:aspartyl-tRNA(Asn)/glutamyl-tRNA(Gln) amidotransferase subunit A